MLNKWLCPYCKIRLFWNPRPHWTCQRPVTCPMDQTLNTLDEMDSVLEVSLSVWPELWHPELFKGAAYTVLYTTPPWGVSITFHPCIFGYSPPSSCSTFCFILLQSRNQYLRNEKCVCVRLLWHGFKHLVCFLIISTCFLLIHTSSVNLQVAVQALPHPSPAGTSHNSQVSICHEQLQHDSVVQQGSSSWTQLSSLSGWTLALALAALAFQPGVWGPLVVYGFFKIFFLYFVYGFFFLNIIIFFFLNVLVDLFYIY